MTNKEALMSNAKQGGSPLQQIFLEAKEMAGEGLDIINLGIGDPKVSPSDKIKKAAIKAVKDNVNFYIPPFGSADFLKAIVAWHARQGVEVQTDEIAASGGSRVILDKVFQVLIEKPGDIFLIPAPYYPSFVGIINSYHGTVELIDTKEDNWILRAKRIEEKITELEKQGKNAKVLVVNSPNNPTGAVIPDSELELIAEVARKHGLKVVSDECYRHFSGEEISSFRKFMPEAIIIDSASKTFAMTGYRVGWGVMPTEFAKKVRGLLGIQQSSYSSISERVALVALQGEGIKDFSEQRQLVYEWLYQKGFSYEKTNAGFYVFFDCSEILRRLGFENSLELARHILKKSQVALAPGEAFGSYANYLRISYCVSERDIKKALNRLDGVLRE